MERNKAIFLRLVMAGLCVVLNNAALAEGIPFGPVTVYPALNVQLKYDDNIFMAPTNERSSWNTIVSTALKAEAKSLSSTYSLSYKADMGRYADSSPDNYNDHQLLGQAALTLSAKTDLGLRAEYLEGHDPRGSTDSVGGATPDEFHSLSLGGVFGYGRQDAKGRIELEVRHAEKRYDNNRASTAARDQDSTDLGATFLYRIQPKTSLLFQVKNTDIDYPLSTSVQDSSERRYLVGAVWQATAKTSGTVKVGRLEKDFDDASLQDSSGVTWELAVRWQPRTYSTFDLSTVKAPSESTGQGNFILGDNIALAWTYNWKSFFSSTLNVGFAKDDFSGADIPRQDDVLNYGMKLDYQMRRWLNLGLSYHHTDRDSSLDTNDYNRNIYMITLGAAL